MAFCLGSPFVASTIVGATSVAQLDELLAARATTLSPDTLAAIDLVHAALVNPAR
jgi:aryl-alcohol dehydrogenase-like predicted oxidoreductase